MIGLACARRRSQEVIDPELTWPPRSFPRLDRALAPAPSQLEGDYGDCELNVIGNDVNLMLWRLGSFAEEPGQALVDSPVVHGSKIRDQACTLGRRQLSGGVCRRSIRRYRAA